jgi:hypothetical protein
MGANRSCVPVSVKDDAWQIGASLFRMQLLKKVNDQTSLQILCDLLDSGGISYRVEGAGMNSLMPLPGLIEARVLVGDGDIVAAQVLLADIEGEESDA